MYHFDKKESHLNMMRSILSYVFVDDYEWLLPSFQLHILMDANHHTYIEWVLLAGSCQIFFSQPTRVEAYYIVQSHLELLLLRAKAKSFVYVVGGVAKQSVSQDIQSVKKVSEHPVLVSYKDLFK